MQSPNPVCYAPSELSQDAFFAWLLAWADPSNAHENQGLHKIGFDFLTALLRVGNPTIDVPPSPVKLEVRKQLGGIDIVVEVGNDLLVAIEDKVHTSEHSDQLKRYRDFLSSKDGYPARKHCLVYLRTGEQADLEPVKSAGWAPFGRFQILEALERAISETGSNAKDISAILSDFLGHLKGIDKDVRGFRALLPDGWTKKGRPAVQEQLRWSGPFQELRDKLQDEVSTFWWGYVPNADGGFMGFSWGEKSVPSGYVYLMIEHDTLKVKVFASESQGSDKPSKDKQKQREIRDEWVRYVSSHASSVFEVPKHRRLGAYMTVGVRDGYLQSSAAGDLDFDATTKTLRDATKIVWEMVEKVNSRTSTASAP